MNWRMWRHNKRDMSRTCARRRGFYNQNGPGGKAEKKKLLEEWQEREAKHGQKCTAEGTRS